METYITIADYAKRIGISPQAVYRKIQRGTFQQQLTEMNGKMYVRLIVEDEEPKTNNNRAEAEKESRNTTGIGDGHSKNSDTEIISSLLHQLEEKDRQITALHDEVNTLLRIVDQSQKLHLLSETATDEIKNPTSVPYAESTEIHAEAQQERTSLFKRLSTWFYR